MKRKRRKKNGNRDKKGASRARLGREDRGAQVTTLWM
jgi:hypothetical protein